MFYSMSSHKVGTVSACIVYRKNIHIFSISVSKRGGGRAELGEGHTLRS